MSALDGEVGGHRQFLTSAQMKKGAVVANAQPDPGREFSAALCQRPMLIVFSKASSPAELSLRGIRLAGNLRDCTIDEAYPATQRDSGPDSSELSKEILRE